MPATSNIELARLSELIDDIYKGATDPEAWNRILPKIADWVDAKFGLLFTPLHPPDQRGFYFNHGIPEAVMHLWSTRWHGEDTLVNTIQQKGMFIEGHVFRSEDVMPFEEIQQSPIHRELNHPNGIDHFLISSIFDMTSSNGMPTALNFYRSINKGPFTAQERERLFILMPHISRAFGVMIKLREADFRISASLSALNRISTGVLLFNPRGAVTFLNRVASRILEEQDGLKLRKLHGDTTLGEIAAEDRNTHQDLVCAIHSATSPDILKTEHFSRAVLVPRPSGRQDYMLNFSSLAAHNEFGSGIDAPCAIAFITDSAEPVVPDADILKNTFGLTPAEIRLTGLMAECLTAEEAAAQLELSSHTVRSQLKSIYQKTRTNSRAKLMRLIMSLSQGKAN